MQVLDAHTPAPRAVTESQNVFRLRKHDWEAVCYVVCANPGDDPTWEIHLYIGTPENELMAAFCDSQNEVLGLGDKWKTKMLARGWC